MSSPFAPLFPNGTPAWSAIIPAKGNFAPVSVLGIVVVPEVGYGQGGYGAGGYDSPSSTLPAASTPVWTTGSSR